MHESHLLEMLMGTMLSVRAYVAHLLNEDEAQNFGLPRGGITIAGVRGEDGRLTTCGFHHEDVTRAWEGGELAGGKNERGLLRYLGFVEVNWEAGRSALWSVNGPRILQVGYEDEEDSTVIEAFELIGSLVNNI
ncbi:hypothetical protein KSP40_PGU004564 [Platanthera guangdongensis]|uniref:Protein HGH1 C-terminal domain-containing protein n=1 Tax=Platanthera guangdongensis TaxID=2320717 RepID=A0ABR2N5N9_9ASPA